MDRQIRKTYMVTHYFYYGNSIIKFQCKYIIVNLFNYN